MKPVTRAEVNGTGVSPIIEKRGDECAKISTEAEMTQTHDAGFMPRLKNETWDLHEQAENRSLQKSLSSGELPIERYTQFLGQMLHVHRALETALRAASQSHPAVAAVVREEHYQRPRLQDDLNFFGVDPETIEPTPATARLVERIEQTAEQDPQSLLGYHYVLEGSNNGGRIIAKRVAEAYGLTDGRGVSYFDPYGREQRAKWSQFKADMEAQGFEKDQQDAMIAKAREMFAAITDISDDLSQPATV